MAKKKKTKYVVLSIVAALVVLVAINWGNIKFMIDMISSYKNYEDVEENPEDKKDDFEGTNPLLEAIEKEKGEGISADEVNENSNIESSNNDTYVAMLSKYNDRFISLQSQYEEKLNALIKQGYSEYKSGKMSKGKLANKYISQIRTLEKESDASVNALTKEMEQELKDNNFDPSIAQDVKSYYLGLKERKKGEIMAKASRAGI